jgi:carbon storage regulator
MLYLNRKPGEAVIINHCIEVRVVEVRGRTVKLGLTFPPEATVLREEVFEAIKQANHAALEAVHALPAAAGLAVGGPAPGEPAPGDVAAADRA